MKLSLDKTYKIGLSSAEVELRIDQGQVNTADDHQSKSIKTIISSNILTPFNFLNFFLTLLVLLTGEFANILFMGVVISNTVIGIIQEIRAKITLDRLKLITDPHFDAFRDNEVTPINLEDIVLDDVLILKSGQQIPADSIVIDGFVEVNESLLTGEAVIIAKNIEDKLYSGSFIVAGEAKVLVINVGENNYVQSILSNAKRAKKQPSLLRDSMNFIIKCVTILIVPIGLLLFAKQFFLSPVPLDSLTPGEMTLLFNESILSTVAALIGMIPEGLILLTSVTLALGAISLTKHNTLTQELYSLETLARVDMLCLDKTGTLTEGIMTVEEIVDFGAEDLENLIANTMNILNDDNSTSRAIKDYVNVNQELTPLSHIPFSSDRKHSAVTFDGITIIIGAYKFCKLIPNKKIEERIKTYSSNGQRILVVAQNTRPINDGIPIDNEIIGLVVLSDPIRKNTKTTLNYFEQQGVKIKVISGDDYATVLHIASQSGVKDAHKAIDVYDLSDEQLIEVTTSHVVFGRVSPQQKKLMIETLNQAGFVTAMVGDGVNDVMALKAADCSIAMKDGSDATKNIANLVLLDNNFANMPEIVNQGRRVINNIQRTSTLFLTKTIFSLLLSLLTIFFIDKYPFYPIQLTMISSLCIGIPAFVLSLEANFTKVTGNFLANIFSKAVPSGLSIVVVIVIYNILSGPLSFSQDSISTMSVITTSAIIFFVLFSLVKKLTLLRVALLLFVSLTILFCFIFLQSLFIITLLSSMELLVTLVTTVFGIVVLMLLDRLELSKKLTEFMETRA